MMGDVSPHTNFGAHSHHPSRETLEMPDFWMWIPSVTGHGKSWNCCSLETVPDRAHKGDRESHIGLKLCTFSDKILAVGSKEGLSQYYLVM